jgi:predicted GNAT family acetyltransferase
LWTKPSIEEWLDKLVLKRAADRAVTGLVDRDFGTSEFLVEVGHQDQKSKETEVFAKIKVEWIYFRHGDEFVKKTLQMNCRLGAE